MKSKRCVYQFLGYLQLKCIIKTNINITNNPLEPSKSINDIIQLIHLKQLTSIFYKIFQTSDNYLKVPAASLITDLTRFPSTDFWIEINKISDRPRAQQISGSASLFTPSGTVFHKNSPPLFLHTLQVVKECLCVKLPQGCCTTT